MQDKILQGHVWHCNDKTTTPSIEYWKNGAIYVNSEGTIEALGNYKDIHNRFSQVKVEDYSNSILIPGFIDTHLHMPQLDIIGSYGENLLKWLKTYAFPAEELFTIETHCRSVSKRLADELIANGVTTSAIFTTSHKTSTEALFTEIDRRGLKAIIGKVSMNRHAPPGLLQETSKDIEDQKILINKWHNKNERLHYALTPRFAPSCSHDLLKALGDLKQEKPDLWVQTHHAETKAEITWVKELFPKSKNYLSIYDDYGLLDKKTILAHSIHSTDDELSLLSEKKASISHCPSSNLFLGSGLMPLKKYIDKGISVSLGSDIGGGSSISPWQTMNEAYKISALRDERITPQSIFYMATLGGARSLGFGDKTGNFTVGKDADLVVLNLNNSRLLANKFNQTQDPNELLLPMMMLADDRIVEKVFVQGKELA